MWNLHTNFRFEHEPQIGPSHRRQVVHARPQTPRDESVAKPETLLLIILSMVCKYYIYKGSPWKLVQPVFQKESLWVETS